MRRRGSAESESDRLNVCLAFELNHCSHAGHKLCSYTVRLFSRLPSMSSRKFTVFVDDVSTTKSQQVAKPPLSRLVEEEPGISSLSAAEKENLHPLTGGRLRSSSTIGVKRKSPVLATKLHNPPNAKGTKQTPTLVPSKRRKVTSLSDGETELSRPRARRVKPVTRRRRSPELASIAEEKDERPARKLSHSYNLTVCPLANVSDAVNQLCPSAVTDSKTEVTKKRVLYTFSTIQPRRHGTHGSFTDWFHRAGATRLRSISCRCSHHRYPFNPCPSSGPRKLCPSSNPVHSREEANLRLLYIFIADPGIFRM